MSLNFPGSKISKEVSFQNINETPYKTNGLIHQFNKISTTGQLNQIVISDSILTTTNTNGKETHHYEIGEVNNHFQGMVRHRNGKHLIISAGNSQRKYAHLLTIELQRFKTSNPNKKGPIGSNMVIENHWRVDQTRFLSILEEGDYWHAGGISLLGDILVVPLEAKKKKKSKIVFLNASDPKKIKKLDLEIPRPKVGTKMQMAGCASLIRLKDKRYLCAVWTDSDDFGHRFDFYVTDKKRLNSNFIKIASVQKSEIDDITNLKPRLQSMQFIYDNDELSIIGEDNSSKASLGKNRIFLFKLSCLIVENNLTASTIDVDLLKYRIIQGGGQSYNFGSAPGTYVDNQGNLILYCAYTWRTHKALKFAEFAQKLKAGVRPITKVDDAIIELYTDKNYMGRKLVLYGQRISEVEFFDKTSIVGESKFGDKVQSISYILPSSHKYVLYENEKYNDGDTTLNQLTLKGTGNVVMIPDLSDQAFIESLPHCFHRLPDKRSLNKNIDSIKLLKNV